MVNFIVYDLIFMVLFAVVVIFLLNRNKKNLKRHGWIFLYHSKFGLKFIDWVAKTFGTILRPLQYVIVASGYILMTFMVWLMGLSVWRYVTSPIPEQLRNVPPIAPLIPYFPRLFNLDSFFPPLFFTYFLIALAIVAVSHEFSHGILARLNKIKVKTTGLAFFGPFFGAFVEPDEKQMAKMKKLNPEAKPEKTIIIIGQGMVVPGLDKALEEKELNKEYEINIPYKEGFGDRKRELVKTIPLKVFTEQKINPQPGATLFMDNMLARIITISGARVLTDFNNPLSGKDLSYKFKITRMITDEKEKLSTFFRFFLRLGEPDFELQDNKVILKGSKPLEAMVNMSKDKFKEIFKKDLEFKGEKEKEPEAKTEESNK